ncbi:uncharacterized protein LOC132188822 [Corylus avellana]|uniref:uncharacterized protein LOC132188369 n=1 Tax=Corylus avellana TaxID=13451 RepID=UPI00286A8E9A|nr:uncharacterized protein LOC132188369 [Corylus avellana]XP_059459363.1 uncharacterized protein LOC132188822 [Corylus avellana]
MSPCKMKLITILACLIFVSCMSEVMILSISALESPLEHQACKLSNRLMQEQDQVHGHDEKGYKEKQEIYDSGKSQRGKQGAYGGANIVHRPSPGEKNAASMEAKPRFVISTLIFYVSLGLILGFSFQLV